MSNFIKRVEILALRPFIGVFNSTARYISYTFGVAFTTSLGGFLIAAYIAIFLMETVQFQVSNTKDNFILLFSILVLFLYAPGYYLHFGILYRLGIPGFSRRLNQVNRFTRNNTYTPPETDGEVLDLLKSFERLPVLNMIAALIYPSIVMLAVVTQELFIGTVYNSIMMLIGISSAIFIYIFSTYIAAELLTGSMRKTVKQDLVKRSIPFEETFSFSIRNKFIFINLLILIAMSELGLMLYVSTSAKFSIVPIIFILLTAVIVGSILFFYLLSIQQSLVDIEYAAMDLASGGKGKLYMRGLDRELVKTSKGFISAAYEVNEIRSNLEKRVEERTLELNEAMEKLREKDDIIQQELKVASRIQNGILPPTPITRNGLHIVAHHQSMEEIGGDIYDIIPMKNNCLGIIISDVSGHGIPAALITVMAKISFIQATRNCLSPKRIFHMVNESLMNVVKTEEYLTAFLLVISSSFDVLYSNASHRKAQVFRNGGSSIEKWDTNGLFLGALENVDVGESYEEKADKLRPGDRVFLFTDGLAEARNREGEEFGEKRISQLLMETSTIPLENARDRILEVWRRFLGETQLNDDVSFLLIELAQVSHDAITHREKGKDLLEKGEYRKAEWEFMSALKFDNSDTLTHQLLGKCYVKTGEHEKAVDHFKEFLDEYPNDAYTLYLTAATQYNMQDFNRALMNARTADRIRPDNPHTLTVIARSLEKLGQTDEAGDIWKKILQLEPENETAKEEFKRLKERKS